MRAQGRLNWEAGFCLVGGGGPVEPTWSGKQFRANFTIQVPLEHASVGSFSEVEAGHWP